MNFRAKTCTFFETQAFLGGGAGIAPQHRVNCGILPAAASLSSPTGEAATPAPKRTLSIVVHGFQVYNTL